MAELSTWVSDKLHDVLGFSDKYTVDYLVGLAISSASPESLVQRVSEDLNVNDEVASFASELWSKLPHATQPAEHPYRAKERALVEQRKKYMGYALVSDDDDDDDDDKVIKTKKSKKDRKRKHLRRKTESSSSDDDTRGGNDASKAIGNDSDSDEWEKEEKERKKDLEERDAFANRLKQKDKEKTRNIMERSDKKVLSKNPGCNNIGGCYYQVVTSSLYC